MSILLLDESLRMTVFYDRNAPRPAEICLYLEETCPPEERLFQDSEFALYLTPGQARALADELLQALRERERRRALSPDEG